VNFVIAVQSLLLCRKNTRAQLLLGEADHTAYTQKIINMNVVSYLFT